jgi:hypothetical protein
MPPPLWHPYNGIVTYYLYETSYHFQLIKIVASRCAPSPDGGLGAQEGGFI